MKNLKKLLLLVPLMALTACDFKYVYVIEGLDLGGGGASQEDDGIEDSGTYDIKVWVDDKIVDLTRTQIQQFASESMGKYTINATVEPVSEGTAASSMLQDVQSGADIFVFAQDQLARLKVAGAVAKQTGSYASFIRMNNSEDSANAASLGENLYAFPITSDNGYFLYYDKSVISDEDAKALGITIVETPLELEEVPSLSFQDRTCLYYVKQNKWECLTNDKALRKHCEAVGGTVVWGLQMLLKLTEANLITVAHAEKAARKINQANPEINERVLNEFLTKLKKL